MSVPQEIGLTYEDMLTWDDQTRMELVRGVPIIMARASREHQFISKRIFRQIDNYLNGKNCEAYYAPFDVRLFETAKDTPKNVDTVVEPDISVICDPNKQDKMGCKGAPDMIVEILSPSSRMHDRMLKFRLYQCAGVREYWMADPERETVEVFLLNSEGIFILDGEYKKGDCIKVNVLEGCTIDLKDVFPS